MITSQITGIRIFGQNPAGFTPLVPQNNGGNGYFATLTKEIKFLYTDLTFDAQIPTTKENFLTMVKTFMDTTYLPTVFTDATVDYDVEISVNAVKLDFEPTLPGVTDRSIWTERTWYWYVSVTMKVNVV